MNYIEDQPGNKAEQRGAFPPRNFEEYMKTTTVYYDIHEAKLTDNIAAYDRFRSSPEPIMKKTKLDWEEKRKRKEIAYSCKDMDPKDEASVLQQIEEADAVNELEGYRNDLNRAIKREGAVATTG